MKLRKQLDSLENFISSLAEFLKPLHDDAVLLREFEGSGFELVSGYPMKRSARPPKRE